MDGVKVDEPTISELRRISHPKGDVFHAMKSVDSGFAGFGEAYFTTVITGDTKGWKKHLRMWINLVVPVGSVEIHVHNETSGLTSSYLLGPDNYKRLTIPPGLWVAFSGRGDGQNLMLNIASIPHDPEEAVSLPLHAFPIGGAA